MNIQTIPFKAKRLNNSKPLWRNNEAIKQFSIKSIDIDNGLAVVPDSTFLSTLDICVDKEIGMQAEYYGGPGIGANCGGARVGTINDLQFKGIGITPMQGDHNNLYNGNGIYHLYEAIVELFNYQIYSRLLPKGLAPLIGLEHIGESPFSVSVQNPSEKIPKKIHIAILIRKAVIRIGHFFPSVNFIQKDSGIGSVKIEKDWAKKNALFFLKQFDNDDELEQFFKTFVDNYAQQFAYAYIHRIGHGALTPSNISFDASWIDLTNMSKIPSGYHYQPGPADPSSFVEKDVIQFLLRESFCHLAPHFNKKNKFDQFLSLYYDRLAYYVSFYSFQVFGLNPNIIFQGGHNQHNSSIVLITTKLSSVLYSKAKAIKGIPAYDTPQGIAVSWLSTIYYNLFKNCNKKNRYPNLDETEQALDVIMHNYYQMVKHTFKSKQTFIKCAAISSVKQQIYTPIFCLGNLYDHSRSIVEKDLANISAHASEWQTKSKWIFGEFENTQTLFKCSSLAIVYDGFTDTLTILDILQNTKNHFANFNDNFEQKLNMCFSKTNLPKQDALMIDCFRQAQVHLKIFFM